MTVLLKQSVHLTRLNPNLTNVLQLVSKILFAKELLCWIHCIDFYFSKTWIIYNYIVPKTWTQSGSMRVGLSVWKYVDTPGVTNQIKFFIILAEFHRSVLRVGGAHLRVIATAGNTAPLEEMFQRCRVVSRAGLFGVGFGPKIDKNFGLNLGLRRTFCLGCTKV